MIENSSSASTQVPQNGETSSPNNRTSTEVKTIFNILSKIKDSDTSFETNHLRNSETKENVRFVANERIQIDTLQRNVSVGSDETDDTVILRRDPNTKHSSINKKAYAKLHRSLSPNRSTYVDRLKEKYEANSSDNENYPEVFAKLDKQTIEALKKKYSPAGLGYIKPSLKNVRAPPVPKPRHTKSQIFHSPPIENSVSERYSLNLDKHSKRKDENSNLVRKSLSNSDEFLTFVKKSDSEESVDKFQKELSYFTMDKKKRSSSFRKLFSGKLFSKDKKKKGEEKNKSQNKENGTFSENLQNENKNFSRHSSCRHTTGPNLTSNNLTSLKRSDSDNQIINYNRQQQLEQQYAQQHISQFRNIKQNFEHPTFRTEEHTPQGYVPMAKPLFKTIQSKEPPNRYMNLQSVQKYIDTSSSDSTVESDRMKPYQNEVFSQNNSRQNRDDTDFRREAKRDTPPRAQETRQHLKLVSPKALIPINSERPLPNPYQNVEELEVNKEQITPITKFSNSAKMHNEQKEQQRNQQQPYFEEAYGTVFDNVELRRRDRPPVARSTPLSLREIQKPPRSPSLEHSKLKLPPNRDIVPLSPRVKSPIPQHHVSTEKLIATELLKPCRSPTPIRKNQRDPSPSHQRLEIDIDCPGERRNHEKEMTEHHTRKPPSGIRIGQRRAPEDGAYYNNRMSQASSASLDKFGLNQRISQASPFDGLDKLSPGSIAHVSSPSFRTPTPNSVLHNRSLSPVRVSNVRPVTPSDSQIPQSPKTTPQKEEMRKSVEAYYWKEIKKLKEQENYDYYIYEMQNNNIPYGYPDDSLSVRRSRSMSPTAQRNSRRSLSLPRETRPTNVMRDMAANRRQIPIPEGRAVTNPVSPGSLYVQTQFPQNFIRNAPVRSTVDGSSKNFDTNSLYRPIFKRGSLSTPPKHIDENQLNQLKRQVSFSNSNRRGEHAQPWPTRNGFTASPPQRRIDTSGSGLEDEVFLPNTPMQRGNETYGYVNVNVKPTNHNLRNDSTNANDVIYYTRRNQELVPTSPPEVLYGQPLDAIRTPQGLTRHGSIQINEELYRQRQLQVLNEHNKNVLRQQQQQQQYQQPQYVTRQLVTRPVLQKREIIINDEIFGQFGGYLSPVNNDNRYDQDHKHQQSPVYSSRQSVAESIYGRSGPRQVLVHNKVCDMYGQIHDSDSSAQKIQKSGVLMGQLQKNPGSPPVVRQSYTQLPNNEQFVRNSRLTSSANDMYLRMQNDSRYIGYVRQVPPSPYSVQINNENKDIGAAPNRPLPPVPSGHGRKGNLRGNVGVSDTESGSDASEIQRILNNNAKSKKLFGK